MYSSAYHTLIAVYPAMHFLRDGSVLFKLLCTWKQVWQQREEPEDIAHHLHAVRIHCHIFFYSVSVSCPSWKTYRRMVKEYFSRQSRSRVLIVCGWYKMIVVVEVGWGLSLPCLSEGAFYKVYMHSRGVSFKKRKSLGLLELWRYECCHDHQTLIRLLAWNVLNMSASSTSRLLSIPKCVLGFVCKHYELLCGEGGINRCVKETNVSVCSVISLRVCNETRSYRWQSWEQRAAVGWTEIFTVRKYVICVYVCAFVHRYEHLKWMTSQGHTFEEPP